MSAILLNDTDILSLSAQVNEQRAAGLIPTGGLLVKRGTYFQLMVTGDSTVNYMIVMEASDADFQAKANILSGLGAFALGAPQYINGLWVQAFGDMAGSGGGGGGGADGAIWKVDDALGADLPTIDASTANSFPLGIVVIDATGQTNAGVFIQDGTTPLLQITTSAAVGAGITGPAGTGNVAINTAGVSLNTENGAAVQAGTSGTTVTHPSGGGNMITSTGTAANNGVLLMRRPYSAAGERQVNLTNAAATMSYDANNQVLCNNLAVNITTVGSLYQFTQLRLIPGVDNARDFGSASNRWNNSFFSVAPTVGSDERIKTAPQAIPDAVLDAVGDVDFVQYKLLSAIAQKGDAAARLHIGVIAQQVVEAFASRGLDATDYGVLCHDEWDAEPEVLDEEGNVISPAREAGDMYSVRYDELLVLEAARVRRELSRLSS